VEQGKLKIAAALEHGPTLVNEFAEMRMKMTAAGNEQYEAWREGSHDDLVLAVALAWWGMGKACWGMGKAYPDRRKKITYGTSRALK
jgi:hypothetical protein